MKRFISMLLAVIMILSLIPSVYADESHTLTDTENDTYIDASYLTDGCDPNADTNWDDSYTVVSVQITWSETNFTYNFGEEWDPELHAYVNQPGWNKDYIDVGVTNHSNCPVNAEIFDAWASHTGTEISFLNDYYTDNLTSAIDPANVDEGKNHTDFRILFDYTPTEYTEKFTNLITFGVRIGAATLAEPEPVTTEPEPEGETEHKHHFVYDQFGRIVCTGCDETKHEWCIDLDYDGLCDECGYERGEGLDDAICNAMILEYLANGGEVGDAGYLELVDRLAWTYDCGFCPACRYVGKCMCL